MTFLGSALTLAERGFSVFPCGQRSKVPPKGSHGLDDATTDPETILAWWTAAPDANIAIACKASGIVVIDVDIPGSEHKQDGRPTMAALSEELGKLPETCEAVTGGGGQHLIFAAPKGAEFRGSLGTGVDLKFNGYILVEPSINSEGNAYRWIRSLVDQMPAEVPPAWLAKMVKPAAPKVTTERPTVARNTAGGTPYGRKAVATEIEEVRTAPTGTRNATLNKAALACGSLCAGGEADDCREDLIAAAMAAGLSEHEARATCESGWRAGMKIPRTAPARDISPRTISAPVVPIASAKEWADPEPLPDGQHPVPSFDDLALPAALRPWLADVADRLQCPPEYGAAAALVALGSLVGRKIVNRPKRFDDWQVVPNLWGAVVAPPSALKSPAIDEALKPLRRLVANAREDHRKATELHNDTIAIRTASKAVRQEALKKALRAGQDPKAVCAQFEDKDDQEPMERRYLLNDGTAEKIGDLLVHNTNGFLVFRDELTGWLAQLDRDGHQNDRPFYLESWAGNSAYSYDRVGRGTIHVPALCLSMFGGIQPGPLAKYLRETLAGGKGHDGLIQRFQIMVYPDPPRDYRNVDRWPDSAARDRAFETFYRLDKMTADQIGAETPKFEGLPFLRFAADAQEFSDAWRCDLMTRARSGSEHPSIEAHLSKYPSLMPSLALICHLADAVASPCGPVSLSAAQRAAVLCGFLEAHARRIYESVAQAGLQAARALLSKIVAGKVRASFSAHDVYEQGWSGLGDREAVEAAAGILVDHGYLREVTEPTTGRPRRRYVAHPSLPGVPGVRDLTYPKSCGDSLAAHQKASSSSSSSNSGAI